MPLFISLICKIDFTGVIDLPGRKAGEIFKVLNRFTDTTYSEGFLLEPCTQIDNFNPYKNSFKGFLRDPE